MSGSDTRSRHALLVGINKYANLSERAQLQGCVNDVLLMKDVLMEHFGFEEGRITLIADEEATRENILGQFGSLIDRIDPDDVVVVHYAGHGSRITDLEGDELDGLDSTLVPHDAVRPPADSEDPPPNVDITDDEIHAWLQELCRKTANVTLIFDCCHSGTITRDANGAKIRQVEPDLRPGEQLGRNPFEVPARGVGSPDGSSGWLPLGERYVLIAGCRDTETAKEYKPSGTDDRNGALTYFLAQALRTARPGSTYRDVFETVATRIIGRIPDQHPQMEGARDREVFGIGDVSPMKYLLISDRSGPEVTLSGGAMHGLTPGSELLVFPAGTKSESEEAIGRVVVVSVSGASSKARVEEETGGGAIVVGCRAAASDYSRGIEPLRIAVPQVDGFDDAVQKLRDVLSESDLLALVPDNAGSDLRIIAVRRRSSEDSRQEPVPQIRELPVDSWVAVSPDGRLSLPIHPIGADHEFKIRVNAERLIRHRRVLEVSPGSADALAGKIEARLLRREPDGSWAVVEPDPASGMITFGEGERIGLRVTNHHELPLYIYVLDLTMVYEIDPWFPEYSGAEEALAPKRTVDVLVDSEYTWQIDEGFPFVRDPDDPHDLEGVDFIKIFASTEPADLTVLEQDAVRAATVPERSSRLGLLLESAAHATRGRKKHEPTDIWTSITIPVRIQARA